MQTEADLPLLPVKRRSSVASTESTALVCPSALWLQVNRDALLPAGRVVLEDMMLPLKTRKHKTMVAWSNELARTLIKSLSNTPCQQDFAGFLILKKMDIWLQKMPDERQPWWEMTLMKDNPGKRSPCWQITLTRACPEDRLPWWKHVQMTDNLYENMSRWQITLMRDHLDERPPWWQITLMRAFPDDITLIRDHPDDITIERACLDDRIHKRPPWWHCPKDSLSGWQNTQETTLMALP